MKLSVRLLTLFRPNLTSVAKKRNVVVAILIVTLALSTVRADFLGVGNAVGSFVGPIVGGAVNPATDHFADQMHSVVVSLTTLLGDDATHAIEGLDKELKVADALVTKQVSAAYEALDLRLVDIGNLETTISKDVSAQVDNIAQQSSSFVVSELLRSFTGIVTLLLLVGLVLIAFFVILREISTSPQKAAAIAALALVLGVIAYEWVGHIVKTRLADALTPYVEAAKQFESEGDFSSAVKKRAVPYLSNKDSESTWNYKRDLILSTYLQSAAIEPEQVLQKIDDLAREYPERVQTDFGLASVRASLSAQYSIGYLPQELEAALAPLRSQVQRWCQTTPRGQGESSFVSLADISEVALILNNSSIPLISRLQKSDQLLSNFLKCLGDNAGIHFLAFRVHGLIAQRVSMGKAGDAQSVNNEALTAQLALDQDWLQRKAQALWEQWDLSVTLPPSTLSATLLKLSKKNREIAELAIKLKSTPSQIPAIPTQGPRATPLVPHLLNARPPPSLVDNPVYTQLVADNATATSEMASIKADYTKYLGDLISGLEPRLKRDFGGSELLGRVQARRAALTIIQNAYGRDQMEILLSGARPLEATTNLNTRGTMLACEARYRGQYVIAESWAPNPVTLQLHTAVKAALDARSDAAKDPTTALPASVDVQLVDISQTCQMDLEELHQKVKAPQLLPDFYALGKDGTKPIAWNDSPILGDAIAGLGTQCSSLAVRLKAVQDSIRSTPCGDLSGIPRTQCNNNAENAAQAIEAMVTEFKTQGCSRGGGT